VHDAGGIGVAEANGRCCWESHGAGLVKGVFSIAGVEALC